MPIILDIHFDLSHLHKKVKFLRFLLEEFFNYHEKISQKSAYLKKQNKKCFKVVWVKASNLGWNVEIHWGQQNLQGTCPSMNLQVQQSMNDQTTTPIQTE